MRNLVVDEAFAAQTEGECDICWLPIEPGEPIVLVEVDGKTGYAHERCSTGEQG